jgi:hypothetical protein
MRSCTDLQARENKWKAQAKNIVEVRETIEGSEMDQVNDLKIELSHTKGKKITTGSVDDNKQRPFSAVLPEKSKPLR